MRKWRSERWMPPSCTRPLLLLMLRNNSHTPSPGFSPNKNIPNFHWRAHITHTYMCSCQRCGKERVTQASAVLSWSSQCIPIPLASITGSQMRLWGLRLVLTVGLREFSFPPSLTLGEFRIETTSLHWVTKGSLRMKLLGRRKGLGHITEIGFGWRCLNVEANHAWKLYYSGNFSYRRNKLFFSQHLCGLSLCNSLTDNRNNPDWHIRSTNELVAKRLFKLGFSDCTAYCTTSQFKGEFLMQKNMTKKVTSSNFDLPLCSTYCFLFLAKLG